MNRRNVKIRNKKVKRQPILCWKSGDCYLCDKKFKGHSGLLSHTLRSKEHKKRIHEYHQEIGLPCYLCPKTEIKNSSIKISVYNKRIEDFL